MRHPHEFTPFYKMPSFWLMVVVPLIFGVIMLSA